mgnify:FL=1
MIRNKNCLKLTIVILIAIISSLVFSKPLFYYITNQLSKSRSVNAEVLIVEGWLPFHALDKAYTEFISNNYESILVSGTMSDHFILEQNGCLIFNTEKLLCDTSKSTPNILEINAFSELSGENSARFKVYINDSLAGDFLSRKRNNKHKLIWNGSLSEIDSLTIEFINDKRGSFGDRNLYIKDINFNNEIVIPFHNKTKYIIKQKDGRGKSQKIFESNAELAKNYLLAKGIDSSKIKAIPTDLVKINRTLNSALTAREWIMQSGYNINGINVLSMGIHSHRTWMTYKKIFKDICNIGIISVPDYEFAWSRRVKVLRTLYEIIGNSYYRIILLMI